MPSYEEKVDPENVFETQEKITEATESLDAKPTAPASELIPKILPVAQNEGTSSDDVAKVMAQWADGDTAEDQMTLEEELKLRQAEEKEGVESDFVADSAVGFAAAVEDNGGGGGVPGDVTEAAAPAPGVIGFEDGIPYFEPSEEFGGGGGGGGGGGSAGGGDGGGGAGGDPNDGKDKDKTIKKGVMPPAKKVEAPPSKGKNK